MDYDAIEEDDIVVELDYIGLKKLSLLLDNNDEIVFTMTVDGRRVAIAYREDDSDSGNISMKSS